MRAPHTARPPASSLPRPLRRRSALSPQVRAWVCVVLVVVMRLLNLAVPILYKKVVDEFAYATAHTHPTAGPPRTFGFKEVRLAPLPGL